MTEIGRVATRHGFGYLLDRRRATEEAPDADRGRRLREMLDELGPTFVKFGQLLSTRPDVVPPDVIIELRKLQDDVSPFPMTEVERVVEEELGLSIERAFRRLRRAAGRGRVDRPGSPRDAAHRRRRRRQGAAPDGATADRVRPSSDGLGRAGRARASAAARLPRLQRARRTSSAARSGRSSTTSRRRATPRPFAATSPATPVSQCPGCGGDTRRNRLLTLERLEGTHVRDLDLESSVGRRPTRPRATA